VQVWVYFYPTGVPALVSAGDLRTQLRAARAFFSRPGRPPALNDIVLVGHSMGGLVCRPLVTHSGEALWKVTIRAQPNSAAAQALASGSSSPLSAHDEALRDLLVFEPEPYVRRVIFIATPHRGSAWADNWLGRLVGGRITIPDDFSDAWKELMALTPQEMSPSLAEYARGRKLNSVRALSPHNPGLLALAALPVAPGIPFHTITGDRGRGDGARASDGVVTYASSHLDGAASEKVVPSGHFLTNDPACTDEIIRILRLQLALESRGTDVGGPP
jgi:pimeloyl-ACP methyl ester carboxylesterase